MRKKQTVSRQRFVRSIKYLIFSAVVLQAGTTAAHEAWIQPHQYTLGPFETVYADVQVGEGFLGERYAFNPGYMLAPTVSIRDATLPLKTKPGSIPVVQFSPIVAGVHVLSYTTTGSVLAHQNWEDFRTYAETEGFTVPDYRNETRPSAVRERFIRHSKALIQVGKDTVKTSDVRVGSEYEWVAVNNPYKLSVGEQVKLQLWHFDAPLKSSHVTVFQRTASDKGQEVKPSFHRTDDQGFLNLAVSPGQQVLVSTVVFSEQDLQQHKDNVEWQTDWISISFEIPQWNNAENSF